MHRNKFWLLFLAVIACSALGYTFLTAYRYYNYNRLDTRTEPSAMTWKVAAHGSDAFTLVADYEFIVNSKTYSGSYDFTNDLYLNRWTAQNAIPNRSALKWHVWYDQNKPDVSSLEKNIPFKDYIYTIILWGIFVYFLWLGFYVSRYSNRE